MATTSAVTTPSNNLAFAMLSKAHIEKESFHGKTVDSIKEFVATLETAKKAVETFKVHMVTTVENYQTHKTEVNSERDLKKMQQDNRRGYYELKDEWEGPISQQISVLTLQHNSDLALLNSAGSELEPLKDATLKEQISKNNKIYVSFVTVLNTEFSRVTTIKKDVMDIITGVIKDNVLQFDDIVANKGRPVAKSSWSLWYSREVPRPDKIEQPKIDPKKEVEKQSQLSQNSNSPPSAPQEKSPPIQPKNILESSLSSVTPALVTELEPPIVEVATSAQSAASPIISQDEAAAPKVKIEEAVVATTPEQTEETGTQDSAPAQTAAQTTHTTVEELQPVIVNAESAPNTGSDMQPPSVIVQPEVTATAQPTTSAESSNGPVAAIIVSTTNVAPLVVDMTKLPVLAKPPTKVSTTPAKSPVAGQSMTKTPGKRG